VVEERVVAHTAEALQAWIETLLARAAGDAAQIAIGLEVPRGAIVDLCLAHGCAVYALNPKQMDRFRDRLRAAGAKDDRCDSEVIARALRTDPHAFRPVAVEDPRVIQLREWSRVDDELGREVTRCANRLRDLVARVMPGLLALCPAADEPWFWALLELAPTPALQRQLSLRRVERLLQAHRIRRLEPAHVRDVLQHASLYTAPGVVEAVHSHLQVVLPQIQLFARQRRAAAQQLTHLLETLEREAAAPGDPREHSDAAIVRSMPGIGTRIAARMLAEASQPLADRAYHVLRALMGVAPVTHQSGRRRTVTMRYACHPRLREAAYHWALCALPRDPDSRTYYTALRTRGHSHARALRSVVDRLLRILATLLTRGQLFNPRHQPPAAVSAEA
jgi:transposase